MEKNRFIPSLTPLRGIAATLVVFFHFHIFLGPLTAPDNFVVSKLYLMVDLFFVLSGFIMAHVYGHKFMGKIQKVDFLKFMKARFARLYPIHIVTFVYLLIWAIYMRSQINFLETPAIVQSIFDNSAIIGVLTLTQAWGTHMEATWNTASWSISVEWFLYLLFPFLAFLFYKYKRIAAWAFGLGSLIMLFGISYYIEPIWIETISKARGLTDGQTAFRPTNTIDIITGFALLRGFCSFVFGMITYEVYKTERYRGPLKKGYWFPLIWCVLFSSWINDILLDPFAILLFSFLILHTAYAEGALKKILNSKVFNYLGDISYSIYMVHIPIILTLFITSLIKGKMPAPPAEINFVNNWIGATILFIVVLVFASLSYRFVENPARKALKKL